MGWFVEKHAQCGTSCDSVPIAILIMVIAIMVITLLVCVIQNFQASSIEASSVVEPTTQWHDVREEPESDPTDPNQAGLYTQETQGQNSGSDSVGGSTVVLMPGEVFPTHYAKEKVLELITRHYVASSSDQGKQVLTGDEVV